MALASLRKLATQSQPRLISISSLTKQFSDYIVQTKNFPKVFEREKPRNVSMSMVSSFQLLLNQKRSLCTKVSTSKWKVQQVTTSNFNQSLEEIKTHISSSDFVSISMGSSSMTQWHRTQPFDTAVSASSVCSSLYVLREILLPFKSLKSLSDQISLTVGVVFR